MNGLRKLLSNDVWIIVLLSAVAFIAAIELDAITYVHELVADHSSTGSMVRHMGSLVLITVTGLFVFSIRKSLESERISRQLEVALEEKDAALLHVREIARLDELSELLNRRGFLDVLGESLSRNSRSSGKCAVVLVDIDRFKAVNDELGHASGDLLLKLVGQRLRERVRRTDYVARFGGDVYGIVLNHLSDYSGAGKVARKLLDVFDEPFEITQKGMMVSCSIGISVSPQDSDDPALLVQYADMALSQAKARGRNCYQFYTSLMQAEVQGKLALERDLKLAIRDGQLEAWFQPQFQLEPLKLTGFEALVRWNHPERGMLYPDAFIELAERAGLICAIGCIVLDKACARLEDMQKLSRQPLSMSVNLSPLQIEDPNLVGNIRDIIKRHDINPSQLVLEITENILLQDTDETLATLAEIKAMGIQVALDDFGTGYSAIAYLQRFQFDQIKIDRSFIMNAHLDDKNIRLVKLMLGIASQMGMETVAEGIENQEVLAVLQGLDCPLGQGYFFSKPVTGAEALQMITMEHAEIMPQAIPVSQPVEARLN